MSHFSGPDTAMRATITVPLLTTRDLAATLAFYILQLGFRAWLLNDRDYTVVSRDHLFIYVCARSLLFVTDRLNTLYRDW